MPFLLPPLGALFVLAAGCVAVAVVGVALAALAPALWISRQQPAMAMRE
ncbi:MAG TPA: hypothetical protein PLJ35_01155 [Anaerolineae bacterium]|nr:hypothetical protein [Anaerolineae bacterium]HOQ97412.1 hypothetical protein [Anaerolineae bacterium]HPL27909.1 hypothetical protein [Anaerolineae bacterium]